jgi:peptidoglycan L-alanyl-D-glutamate endopeptidase CwlK
MQSPLSIHDHQRLAGVHPDLVRVVERARLALPLFMVEGLRIKEHQAKLVAMGASHTLNNRHLTGHAVDLAYWLDDGEGVPETGEVRWDWPLARQLAAAMQAAAEAEGVALVWVGDWASFPDGPHFELDRRSYP